MIITHHITWGGVTVNRAAEGGRRRMRATRINHWLLADRLASWMDRCLLTLVAVPQLENGSPKQFKVPGHCNLKYRPGTFLNLEVDCLLISIHPSTRVSFCPPTSGSVVIGTGVTDFLTFFFSFFCNTAFSMAADRKSTWCKGFSAVAAKRFALRWWF